MHGRKTGYEANQAETSSSSELLLCTQFAPDTPSTGRGRLLAGQRLQDMPRIVLNRAQKRFRRTGRLSATLFPITERRHLYVD